MAISRERKEELVAQYVQLINDSDAFFVADYKNLNMKKLTELRREVRKAGGAFHITKNTLIKVALEKTGNSVSDELLQGQVATGFALGEAPTLAKTLVDYAESEENFILRGGLMDANPLSADDIVALAKLPSLDQLRGTLAGMISAPARNLASVIAGGVRQVINVVDAYSKKDDAAEAAA